MGECFIQGMVVGCWVLGSGCCLFVVGCWVVGGCCWLFVVVEISGSLSSSVYRCT